VLLYEIHDSARFPSVQDFVSYCRLIRCSKESAGKKLGTGGRKIGNAHLKWAFSEATCLFLRGNGAAQKYLARLESKHGKGKALGSFPGNWAPPSTTCSNAGGIRYEQVLRDVRLGPGA